MGRTVAPPTFDGACCSDWGLTWNVGLEAGGFLVSDDVMIELEVAADELAATAAGAGPVRATA